MNIVNINRKCHYSDYKCFEEIYKTLYKHWSKLHKNKHIENPSLQFLEDTVPMIPVFNDLFMKNSDIEGVSGKLPSLAYKKFLYHTIVHKLCKKTSESFIDFLEILFMTILEENAITGIIKLEKDNYIDNTIIENKIKILGKKDSTLISNTDIINMLTRCRRQLNKK